MSDLKEGEMNPAVYAMQLTSSSVLPMVFKAAAELGVFDVIADTGPASLSQIASQIAARNNTSVDAALLDRILRLLASHSILTCSPSTDPCDDPFHRLYYLAPVAQYFLSNQDEGGSLVYLLNFFQDKVMLDMWYSLKDAVLEGGLPFHRTYGMSAVDYVGRDVRFREVFQSSMKGFDPMFSDEILRVYNGFEGLTSLVDVGGGNASILNKIITKHPSIKGINFDLPAVIENLPSYPECCRRHFESIPKADAIFMKWMLHSWDDKHCVKILKNCYEALPEKGKVILIEVVMPETPQPTSSAAVFQFDLFMVNMNPTGKERTMREFESLRKQQGFLWLKCHVLLSVSRLLNSTRL